MSALPPRRLPSLALGLLTCIVAHAPNRADARLLDWTFTGVVADVPPLAALPRVGDPISLHARIDDGATNRCSPGSGGWYDGVGRSRLAFGPMVFSRPTGSGLEVNAPDGACGRQQDGTGVTLRYLAETGTDGWTPEAGPWPAMFLGHVVAGFDWPGTHRPPDSIDGPVDEAHIYVFLNRADSPIVGRIDHVTVRAVPAPPLLPLVTLGACTVGWRLRTRVTRPADGRGTRRRANLRRGRR